MDNNMNIKDRLKAADFALWETVLYLDAYPNDKEALASFYKLRDEAEKLTLEYEAKYGTLTAFGNEGDSWQWTKGPWPWESEAN
jgi:spore coat protein JB